MCKLSAFHFISGGRSGGGRLNHKKKKERGERDSQTPMWRQHDEKHGENECEEGENGTQKATWTEIKSELRKAEEYCKYISMK